MQAVAQVSAHPLYKPLVDLGWHTAMGCQDILTALRAALADNKIPQPAADILAKHVTNAAACYARGNLAVPQ